MNSKNSINDTNLSSEKIRPTQEEIEFLEKAYNFFFDIFDEVFEDSFWDKDPYYRFSKIRDAFLIYSELLEYEPIEFIINVVKKVRPNMEGELSKEFNLFIRNLLIHFPFFKQWDEVEFNKTLINWSKPCRSIDKFLSQYSGHCEIKYRIWNHKKKEMTYASINLPANYYKNDIIKLKNIISEKDGVRFSLSLMKSILNSQI